MKRLLLPLGLCALLPCRVVAAPPPPATFTVFLVRHAEKATDDGSDPKGPPLTDAGRARAECLVHVLQDAGIKRVYVSDTHRTQQTADPLVKELGLKATIVSGSPEDMVKTLVKDAFRSGGGNALVVGHQNTVPQAIEGAQAGSIPPIPDTEYDGLYVVTMRDGKATPVMKLRYCAASPPAKPKPPK